MRGGWAEEALMTSLRATRKDWGDLPPGSMYTSARRPGGRFTGKSAMVFYSRGALSKAGVPVADEDERLAGGRKPESLRPGTISREIIVA